MMLSKFHSGPHSTQLRVFKGALLGTTSIRCRCPRECLRLVPSEYHSSVLLREKTAATFTSNPTSANWISDPA
jgi:hypothetical protein